MRVFITFESIVLLVRSSRAAYIGLYRQDSLSQLLVNQAAAQVNAVDFYTVSWRHGC